MSDTIVLGCLAGVLGLLCWFMFSTVTGISQKISSQIAEIRNEPFQINEDFKQDLYDLMHMALEDTVGSMNVPTAKDHLVGGIMQLIQARLGGFDPRSILNDAMSSLDHGAPEIETEEKS